MLGLIHLSEALRMFRRSLRVRFTGARRYSGDSAAICRQIIADCWDDERKYFRVSTGHFSEFYCRDFGWCCKALIDLGYKEEVKQTLVYALSVFERHGRVCVAISPSGRPFDFPCFAPDSLAFLLNSLCLLGDKGLAARHKRFLNREILRFFDVAIDKNTGLIRKDKYFSSIKDHALRKSSCYDNCMAYMIQRASADLGLTNPLKHYDYRGLVLQNFWNGRYFLDDLSGKRYVAGDANMFPFWTGLVDDVDMLNSVILAVREAGLDKPFPLRYVAEGNDEAELRLVRLLAKDYEGRVAWAHIGILFIEVAGFADVGLQKKYLLQYKGVIEKQKNYLEVFFPDKRPYHSFFYYSDEGMLWCANYLRLTLRHNLSCKAKKA